jgi:carboxypeptidase PM20D1
MKKFLGVVGFVFLLLISALVVRTMLFTSKRTPVPEARKIPVDEERLARHLAGALRIPTVSYQDRSRFDPAAFRQLHAYLEETFPKVHATLKKETVNDYSLLYTWKGRDPALKPILLMAHQDVVPVIPGTEEDWVQPPFGGEIADGYIWGRGALDVKSGMMGILEAVEFLLQEGFQPKRTVYLAFGHDEEVGGVNGAAQIAKRFKAGNIRFEYVLDEGGVVLEGIIPRVSSAIAMIGVAEKGYVSVELTVRSEGGHSSMPPKHTAVGILSKAITRLEDNPFPGNMTYAAQLFDYIGPEMPFLPRMMFANLWLTRPLMEGLLSRSPEMNAMIRTTTAATMFNAGVKENVLPIKARAVVNFRILPGETAESVVERVVKIIDDPEVQVKTLTFGSNPSPVSDIHSTSYEALRKSIYQVSADEDLIVAPYLVVGATDSRYFTGLSDNVYRFLLNKIGPADLKRVHGTNERISVDNYAQVVRMYVQLLRNSEEL